MFYAWESTCSGVNNFRREGSISLRYLKLDKPGLKAHYFNKPYTDFYLHRASKLVAPTYDIERPHPEVPSENLSQEWMDGWLVE